MTRLAIQPNSHVTLAYTLRSDTGEVLDASDAEGGEPICYVHGYGMIVAGLEAALVGLSAGDRKEIHVAAEDGFGLRDEELVVDIDRSELPDKFSSDRDRTRYEKLMPGLLAAYAAAGMRAAPGGPTPMPS